jgi:hypothetical protein
MSRMDTRHPAGFRQTADPSLPTPSGKRGRLGTPVARDDKPEFFQEFFSRVAGLEVAGVAARQDDALQA